MSAGRKRPDLPKIKMPVVENHRVKKKHSDLTDSVLISLKEGGPTVLVHHADLEGMCDLGRGSFGVVKKMIHKPTGLQFAVKFIRENLIDTCESRDIEVSLKLGDKCKNLLRFYGALFTDDSYWILTDAMDASLDSFYLKAFEMKLRLPESFHALIARSVLNGLQYMKDYRIMHRDIKPSNILLNSAGEIKICDYGISGFLNNESLCRSFKGCHRYMSPEKLNPRNGYSIKADVWSLGISLIETATGCHPYSDFNAFFDLTTNIIVKEPPKLDVTKFSPEFCSFVNNCLIKDEDQRPRISELMRHQFIEINQEKNIDKIRAIIQFICDTLKK